MAARMSYAPPDDVMGALSDLFDTAWTWVANTDKATGAVVLVLQISRGGLFEKSYKLLPGADEAAAAEGWRRLLQGVRDAAAADARRPPFHVP